MPAAKKSSTDLALVVLGVIAWVIAFGFGAYSTTDAEAATASGRVNVKTPNVAAAGAACGFGIGGGLCFLGAALVAQRGRLGPVVAEEENPGSETKH